MRYEINAQLAQEEEERKRKEQLEEKERKSRRREKIFKELQQRDIGNLLACIVQQTMLFMHY